MDRGWITIPNKKHMEKIQANLGVDGVKVAAATPGVKRTKLEKEVEAAHEGTATEFRSNVGSLTFAVKDVEVLAFSAKECSRCLHDPDPEAWMGLTRIARFMVGKLDWATHLEIDENIGEEVDLVVTTDSDWGMDKDARSTTGLRIRLDSTGIWSTDRARPSQGYQPCPQARQSSGPCLVVVLWDCTANTCWRKWGSRSG